MATRRTRVLRMGSRQQPYALDAVLVCAVCEREVDRRTEACRDPECDGCTHLRCATCLRVTARAEMREVDGLRHCAGCWVEDAVEAAA